MQFLNKSALRLNYNYFSQLVNLFSTKSTKQKKQNSNMPKLPDRWIDYKKCGKRIEGTRIICFKTPLRDTYFYNNQSPELRWGIRELIQTIPNLGLVIDLTFSTKYYEPSELTSRDIDHQKILCEGHVIPRPPVVKKFIDTIDEFLEHNEENDKLIGVHCTHGLNRTGYLVCRYMIDRMSFDRLIAIDLFNSAREHQMERKNYVNHLKDPEVYQNTNREDKRKNRDNLEIHTGSEQGSTIDAEPIPGQRNTYFNPGPGRNSGYSNSRSEQDSHDSCIGTRQDYGDFGLRTPQRNALGNRLELTEGDSYKDQKKNDTRNRSSHRRDNEKDKNIHGFATGSGHSRIVAEPIPGQRNVYFNPGPGRNSNFRIPKLGQKSHESHVGTSQNESGSTKETKEHIASENELNPGPLLNSDFRIPKLGHKSRNAYTEARKNEDDFDKAKDQQMASGNEIDQNYGESCTRPKQISGEVRTGSGRFSSGSRSRSVKNSRDGKNGYDRSNGRVCDTAGLDDNDGGLRRENDRNRKAKSRTNTDYNWRERD